MLSGVKFELDPVEDLLEGRFEGVAVAPWWVDGLCGVVGCGSCDMLMQELGSS